MSSTTTPDLYEVLGVGRDASDEQIESAYRRLAHVAHPDKGGTGALFRLLTEAREVLKDPARRAEYDAAGAPPRDSTGNGTPGRAWQPEQGDASGEPETAGVATQIGSSLDRVTRWTFYGAVIFGAATSLFFGSTMENVNLAVAAVAAVVVAVRIGSPDWHWAIRVVIAPVAFVAVLVAGVLAGLLAMIAVMVIVVILVGSMLLPDEDSGIRRFLGAFTTKPRPGEIWYADFPFEEDSSESKDRPCLVVAVDGSDFITCKITSVDHSDRPGYHPVTPAVTGLPKLSFIRVRPTVVLPRKRFRSCVGKADPVLWAWAVQQNSGWTTR